MGKQRFNGLSFTIDTKEMAITCKKFTLEITDNSAVAKRRGRPDGYVVGDVEASGEITVDSDGLKAIVAAAKSAGSFQALKPFPIVAYAKVGDDEVKVEAFGCRLKVSSILDVDTSSSDETEFTLPYDVTDPEFVKINGVPYITPDNNK